MKNRQFSPALWTHVRLFLFCLLMAGLPSTTLAMSECVPTNEDMTDFLCFTAKSSSTKNLNLKCEDTDHRCGQWAQQGECSRNPQFMLLFCNKSCESCISGHAGPVVQVAADPAYRSRVIELLVETQIYLKEQADFKAKILRTCLNKEAFCTQWAAKGECDSNPTYMQQNCAPVCKTCE